VASLLAKPSPLNINLGSDRFSMFNKKRDIRYGYARMDIIDPVARLTP
jgi:hypothetical protein